MKKHLKGNSLLQNRALSRSKHIFLAETELESNTANNKLNWKIEGRVP